MKKNWRIEIKDADGNIETSRSAFKTDGTAIDKALNLVQKMYGQRLSSVPSIREDLFRIYHTFDRFVTVTVFHFDSVVYG